MAESVTYNDAELLALLKIELEKPPDYVAPVLTMKLGAAKERLENKGIVLDMSSHDDAELIVAYAAWLYRLKNEDPDKTKMPRMLQIAIHDRIFHELGVRTDAEV